MLSTRQKGCFSLLGVRPICKVLRGHGGGELGVVGSLRARASCLWEHRSLEQIAGFSYKSFLF